MRIFTNCDICHYERDKILGTVFSQWLLFGPNKKNGKIERITKYSCYTPFLKKEKRKRKKFFYIPEFYSVQTLQLSSLALYFVGGRDVQQKIFLFV